MSDKMTFNPPSLLPNGIKDLLYPTAEYEAAIIQKCMDVFGAFGYNRVKPPLIEFEDSLLGSGPGAALSNQTFRAMDPISGKMLGFRADTTAQIARLAGSRLGGEARPLRLSYAAEILRVNGSALRPDRQFCQVGCELIGASSAKDDAEVMLMALKSLHDCGSKNLSIDLTIPSLIDEIYAAHDVAGDVRAAFDALLQKRDRDGIEDMAHAASADLMALLDASGKANEAFAALNDLHLNDATAGSIKSLVAVYEELCAALKAYELESLVSITVDLIERRGFGYQTGVSFTVFSKDVRGELGRGGRYQLNDDKDSETATGFTLYMDGMMQAFASAQGSAAQEIQQLGADASWSDMRAHQDKGAKIARS